MIKDMKKYNTEQIRDKFNNSPCKIRVKILYEALDYMQQYNGRSRFLCIAMAMGYENFEGKTDTYTLKNDK